MSRTIELCLALALTVGGCVWLAFHVFSPGRIVYVMMLPGYLMIGVGGYWLWGLHYISSASNRYKRGGQR
jgi:hypothetical protein